MIHTSSVRIRCLGTPLQRVQFCGNAVRPAEKKRFYPDKTGHKSSGMNIWKQLLSYILMFAITIANEQLRTREGVTHSSEPQKHNNLICVRWCVVNVDGLQNNQPELSCLQQIEFSVRLVSLGIINIFFLCWLVTIIIVLLVGRHCPKPVTINNNRLYVRM